MVTACATSSYHGVAHEQTGQAGVLPLHILHVTNDIFNVRSNTVYNDPLSLALAMANCKRQSDSVMKEGESMKGVMAAGEY